MAVAGWTGTQESQWSGSESTQIEYFDNGLAGVLIRDTPDITGDFEFNTVVNMDSQGIIAIIWNCNDSYDNFYNLSIRTIDWSPQTAIRIQDSSTTHNQSVCTRANGSSMAWTADPISNFYGALIQVKYTASTNTVEVNISNGGSPVLSFTEELPNVKTGTGVGYGAHAGWSISAHMDYEFVSLEAGGGVVPDPVKRRVIIL